MAIASAAPPHAPATAAQPATAPIPGGDGIFDFTFHDLVSVLNPLQHIPVVSTLYRAMTGDTIKPIERIAGDTLYGGWVGLVSSIANLVFERETGKDFGDTVLAFLEGNREGNSAVLQVADSKPSPAVPSALGLTSNSDTGLSALTSSVASRRTDPELGQRAIYAYRRSIGATSGPAELVPAF